MRIIAPVRYLIVLMLFFFIKEAKSQISIGDSVYYFESIKTEIYTNSVNNKSVFQIIDDTASLKKIDPFEHQVSFTDSINCFWLRYTIENPYNFDKDFIFYLSNGWDKIELFEYPFKDIKSKLTGKLVPISKRQYKLSRNAFYLNLKTLQTKVFWLKFEYSGKWSEPKNFGGICTPSTEKLYEEKNINFYQGIFIGIVLVMMGYNLVLFFSLRDKNYLYYVLLLFSMGFIFLGNYQFDFLYLWPEAPRFNKFLSQYPIYDCLCGASLLLFTQSFLNTKHNKPLAHKVLNFFLILNASLLCISFLRFINSELSWQISSALGVLFYLYILILGILYAVKRYQPSYYFVAGTLFSAIGTIFFLLQNIFHVIPGNFKTYPMQIGNTLDIFMFSLALGSRIKLIREESEKNKRMLEIEKLEKERVKLVASIEAKENERIRISKDLHDEIGSGLSKINILSSKLAGNVHVPNDVAEGNKSIAETAAQLNENMRDLVWVLSNEKINLNEMVYQLREYISDYFENWPIDVKLDLPDAVENVYVRKEAYREVYKTIKESLNNVVKHSKAQDVNISFVLNSTEVVFCIEDNGCGFDVNILKRINGLNNIRERTERIGGKVEIYSVPNSGTKITIMISRQNFLEK